MKKFGLSLLGVLVSGFICTAMTACAETGYVTADLLNVRTAPSMNSEVVDMVEWGDALTITYGPTMGWYEIYHNGTCYYVKEEYVNGSGSSYSDYTGDTYSADDTSYSETSWNEPAEQSGEYLGNFVLTAYCSCSRCTGGSGVTASGTTPTAGHTIAMSGVPFGTKLMINGTVYTVEDRGTSYGHADIYFDNHQDAVNFGVQYADVYQVW